MADIRLKLLRRDAQNKSVTMLCTAVVRSYTPLQMGHPSEELQECNTTVLLNFTQSDAKHPFS